MNCTQKTQFPASFMLIFVLYYYRQIRKLTTSLRILYSWFGFHMGSLWQMNYTSVIKHIQSVYLCHTSAYGQWLAVTPSLRHWSGSLHTYWNLQIHTFLDWPFSCSTARFVCGSLKDTIDFHVLFESNMLIIPKKDETSVQCLHDFLMTS